MFFKSKFFNSVNCSIKILLFVNIILKRMLLKNLHLKNMFFKSKFFNSVVEDLLILVDRKVAGSLNFFVDGSQIF
jgi:hypothetical protein